MVASRMPSTTGRDSMSGISKAASLLVALGPQASARVLQQMKEHEIEALTVHVAKMDGLSEDRLAEVMEECHDMALAHRFIATGGIEYASEILSLAIGA